MSCFRFSKLRVVNAIVLYSLFTRPSPVYHIPGVVEEMVSVVLSVVQAEDASRNTAIANREREMRVGIFMASPPELYRPDEPG
jgi:hypothetical protein